MDQFWETLHHYFSKDKCSDDGSVLVAAMVQVSLILFFSNLYHLVLKRLGQPSVISHMLAGVTVGPMGFGGLKQLKDTNLADMSFVGIMSSSVGIYIMFLVGLELDIPYLRRSVRTAAIVAYGGILVCSAVGAAAAPVMHLVMGTMGYHPFLFSAAIALLFSNTAAPVVVRVTTELKLATSDIGRLAISAAIVNDLTCLGLISLSATFDRGTNQVWTGIGAGLLLAAASAATRPLVRWLNRRNRPRKHIKHWEVGVLLVAVTGVSLLTVAMGYNGMMAGFVMGIFFPREGSAMRTLEDKLTYPVNHIFLPIYFGFTGLQADFSQLFELRVLRTMAIVVVLNTTAKVLGTLLAAAYLNISMQEGLVLGFLLNVKGYVDLIILNMAKTNGMGMDNYNILLSSVVVNSLAVGPAATLVVQLERKALSYRSTSLQRRDFNSELRVLGCLHCPRDAPTMLGLIGVSGASGRNPIAAYLVHLIMLTRQVTTRMLYHQINDYDSDEDDQHEGRSSRQIFSAVDGFRSETGITTRLVTAVSYVSDMHKDVCLGAADVRATVVIVPFHKHQLVDGRMHAGRDDVRAVNAEILRKAPCTVGILVDRGLPGKGGTIGSQNVVVLFFGGPDDREAVALGSRMMIDPSVTLTVVRFLPLTKEPYKEGIQMQTTNDKGILNTISNYEIERIEDDNFMSDFYRRIVELGVVTYIEKFVENGAETVEVLSSMVGVYSLYIVGKGRRALSPLTVGMSDWEQCPELGTIGDLLASSDFMTVGSVLVLQQYSEYSEEDDLHEFMQ